MPENQCALVERRESNLPILLNGGAMPVTIFLGCPDGLAGPRQRAAARRSIRHYEIMANVVTPTASTDPAVTCRRLTAMCRRWRDTLTRDLWYPATTTRQASRQRIAASILALTLAMLLLHARF